jgi:hypothetical protein
MPGLSNGAELTRASIVCGELRQEKIGKVLTKPSYDRDTYGIAWWWAC